MKTNNRSDQILVLSALAMPVTIACAACWTNVGKECCELLNDPPYPDFNTVCPDVITPNYVGYVVPQAPGHMGETMKVQSENHSTCHWVNWHPNALGNCVAGSSQESSCYAQSTTGSICTVPN